METISTIEIFIILTVMAVGYDFYQIFNFNLPHYQQGLILSSGTSPWNGRDEFPSNYKMIYKSKETLYKFVGPTSMVFRYNFDIGNFRNLIALKGVGELKDGEIVFSSRFGLITPLSICGLLCANLVLLGRVPSGQEILGTVIVLFFLTAYFLYCRMTAVKLPTIVAEMLDESIKS